ncbi:MAG: guanylate kinase [Desulfomonilia bacterium]
MRIFISGPSGVGKSTIITEVIKKHPDLVLSISYTTRSPRPGERDGREYFFVSRQVFEDMRVSGTFLEWANVHGQLYGTSLEWVEDREREGLNVLFDIDVQGVTQAQEKGSPGHFILIVPPELGELTRRLEHRGTEDRESLSTRIENAKKELMNWEKYDYLVVNDTLEHAVDTIHTIVQACRNETREVIRRLPWITRIV